MEPASQPGTWKPQAIGDSKKVAGPCELTAIKLTAGARASAASVYDGRDSSDISDTNLKWSLDASTTDVDAQTFNSPLIFKKGVFIVLEQGAGGNEIISYSTRSYQTN